MKDGELLDEPLSNLDAALRMQTRAEISKLHQRLGATFIYVTHDQVEAMTMATRIAVMKEGVLQQVGSPQGLYDNPRNVFVAGFIGSPAMNFFDVAVTGEGPEVFLEAGPFRLQAPDDKVAGLVPFRGQRIILGIRPENIHDLEYAPPGITGSPVRASVEVTEPMGNEVFLHLTSNGHSFLARVDPRTGARRGSQVAVVIDMSRMHAFDPASEQALFS